MFRAPDSYPQLLAKRAYVRFFSQCASIRVDLQCRNFYVRSCVKFTFANKIEAMHERSLVSLKVEPRSTSRLRSALFTLPLFHLRDYDLRALTCVAKNASVEINL